jgi:hypothetical protein
VSGLPLGLLLDARAGQPDQRAAALAPAAGRAGGAGGVFVGDFVGTTRRLGPAPRL